MRGLLAFLGALLLASPPGLRADGGDGGRPRARAPATSPLPVVGAVPSFSYLDQDGRTLSDADLLGHLWIADFIFTSCTNVCPLLSAHMAILQRRLADPDLRFVSFSVDPEHDTPPVLKAYAGRWRQDEARWRLLATTKESIFAVARGMHAAVAPGMTATEPFVHSSDFALVDAAGYIRGIYPSDDEDDVKRLIADASALAHVGLPALTTATDGKRLYAELGCGGCHADPRLAPPLEGLFGRRVVLDDNRMATADVTYLRESLLLPDAKVVAGYPSAMPSYRGQLGEAQLDALVEYLRALPRASGDAAARHRAVDPVCRMEISAGPDTPKADYGAATYYFCSELCRRRFRETPTLYAAPIAK